MRTALCLLALTLVAVTGCANASQKGAKPSKPRERLCIMALGLDMDDPRALVGPEFFDPQEIKQGEARSGGIDTGGISVIHGDDFAGRKSSWEQHQLPDKSLDVSITGRDAESVEAVASVTIDGEEQVARGILPLELGKSFQAIIPSRSEPRFIFLFTVIRAPGLPDQ